jgi:hypothetical protein
MILAIFNAITAAHYKITIKIIVPFPRISGQDTNPIQIIFNNHENTITQNALLVYK